MRIDVLTLFPEFFESPLKSSILARALQSGAVQIHFHNIRDYAEDKHRVADDAPYGGGGGMVMKPEPVVRCVRAVREMLGESGKETPSICCDRRAHPPRRFCSAATSCSDAPAAGKSSRVSIRSTAFKVCSVAALSPLPILNAPFPICTTP